MQDLVNISTGNALIAAFLGYLVVFFGLILLMFVIMILGKIMVSSQKKNASEAVPVTAAPAESEEPVTRAASGPAAPGTAGELKLYDTDPRDAAMIMAIVADTTGIPLNELRFKSIREVK